MPKAKNEQERLEQQLEALQQQLQDAQDQGVEDLSPYKERVSAAQKDLKDLQARQSAAEKQKS